MKRCSPSVQGGNMFPVSSLSREHSVSSGSTRSTYIPAEGRRQKYKYEVFAIQFKKYRIIFRVRWWEIWESETHHTKTFRKQYFTCQPNQSSMRSRYEFERCDRDSRGSYIVLATTISPRHRRHITLYVQTHGIQCTIYEILLFWISSQNTESPLRNRPPYLTAGVTTVDGITFPARFRSCPCWTLSLRDV